jgi:hypothetical protein
VENITALSAVMVVLAFLKEAYEDESFIRALVGDITFCSL